VEDVVVAEIDPVCGMKVLPEKAAASVAHAGRTWYFCSKGCGAKFEANPGKYDGSAPAVSAPLVSIASVPTISSPTISDPAQYTCPMHPEVLSRKAGACPQCGMALESTQPSAVTTRTEYTCPMHPQIVRDGPGACPICGMALEPRTVTAGADNPELTSMTRRLWIGAVLTLPLLAVMVSDVLPGHPLQQLLPGRLLGWIEFALATPVVLWGGWPFFERGWASIIHRSLNMFTLIAIGSGAAYLYSVAAVIAPGIFPATFRDSMGNLGLYFEAAAVITVLVLLGQVLELRARSRTGGAIQALLGLAPKTARRISSGGIEVDVPLSEVAVGDLLRIRPGEKVPVDGLVTEGRS
jgi:Cu+-exporting ATPase